nr:GNAT family N-acetyltransferase [Candidatus Sigynarchaeota archaeon]
MSEQSTQPTSRFLPTDDPKLSLLIRPGGHEKPLQFQESVNLGRPIIAREIEPWTDAGAHELLSDIMAAHEAGDITTIARYKGKNPRRWLASIYPFAMEPRFVGLFFPDGTLLGWVSFTTSPYLPGKAVLGMVIRPPYQNAGLGTAALLHAKKYLRDIMRDASITDIFFETQEDNARVLAIAKKMKVQNTGRRIDQIKGDIAMLAFTNKPGAEA